jgi:hypothetical protein
MSKHDLLIAAAADARPEERTVLAALPDGRRYTELRHVWEDLPLVPVAA